MITRGQYCRYHVPTKCINRRGTWDLINAYGDFFPIWPCLIVSLSFGATIYYLRPVLNAKVIENEKHVESIWKAVQRVLIMRSYHYVFAFACIMTWRCLWEIPPLIWGELCKLIRDLWYRKKEEFQTEIDLGTTSQLNSIRQKLLDGLTRAININFPSSLRSLSLVKM
jgi:Fuseless